MTQEQVTNLCRKLLSEETSELAKQMVELTIKVNNYKKRIDHIDEKIDEIAGMIQQSPAIDGLAARGYLVFWMSCMAQCRALPG